MENKNILQKLNNQYFKSLKRFEKAYHLNDTYYAKKFEEFNSDYLKIISAVINKNTYNLDLNSNRVYISATISEKNEIRILIDSAH